MFSWYTTSSQGEKRTFWACFLGWALDALDVQLLGLAIPALIVALGISKGEAGVLGSATLFAGAFGGWIAGAFSDRFGRVKTLQIMIIWFAVSTFACAFAQNYTQLLALKTLQGFGFGGEWATGAVLMAEVIRPENRGKALGWVQSGWAVGWGGAVILSTLIFHYVPKDVAWRFFFGIGLLPALLVLYVRRGIPEPVRPEGSTAAKTASAFADLFAIFKPEVLRATLIGALFGVGAHGGYAALTTFLPTFLRLQRHLSVIKSGEYLAVIIIAFFIGCITSGTFSDFLGRRLNVAFFAVACIATVLIYVFAPLTNTQMLFLGFPLGFFSAGIPASMAALFSELYPAGMRGTGIGFCYNFGRVIAAGFPALVGYGSQKYGLGASIGINATLAYSLVLVAVLFLPESARKPFATQMATSNA
ncbi:MAG: MFS transporter [Hyphomicrobiales bacterium]|nr:MFS transporter [Hyphomicrobiales bacterium]